MFSTGFDEKILKTVYFWMLETSFAEKFFDNRSLKHYTFEPRYGSFFVFVVSKDP